MNLYPRDGFTLVELAIVLVIVGLLISAVLVGQDLVESAEVRANVKTLEEMHTAINLFRSKYNCLPGDCPDATEFGFTSANGNPVNGNGDGNYLPYTNDEYIQGTHQLVEANLTPLKANDVYNFPYVRMTHNDVGGAYLFTNDLYDGSFSGGYLPVNELWGNTILVGARSGDCTSGTPFNALFTQAMDIKVDDGKASSGRMSGHDGTEIGVFGAGTCGPAETPCVAGGEYDVSNPAAKCRMVVYW
jgi:prepilin-type N-terminal cleavage/methylation domain-containing protein